MTAIRSVSAGLTALLIVAGIPGLAYLALCAWLSGGDPLLMLLWFIVPWFVVMEVVVPVGQTRGPS
jgi:hypothetical protein